MNSVLFSPLKIRQLTLKNRIVVSPMCQYSAKNGIPDQWHLVHLGSRAVGGAALVFSEATSVSAEGRISDGDLGIWNEEQITAFQPITEFIKTQGSVPGIQLAHAGRKGSTPVSWKKHQPYEQWVPWAPSAIKFDTSSPQPKEMTAAEIDLLLKQFTTAAANSLKAGFQIVEIHMAHGYLLNEFLSPLTNLRKDEYGGSLENRMKLPLRVAKLIRDQWPSEWPVFVRISASDWVEGGWTIEDSVIFSKKLKDLGIDLMDCSSGGSVPHAKIAIGPGYQVPFSEEVRKKAEMATGAVGIITDAHQAEDILKQGKADVVFLARELLRDPYWPLHAAKSLGIDVPWPDQYARAKT